MAVKPGMVLYVRNLILRGICVVYLIAFLNFYYQAQGLFGNTGILPARLQVENVGTAKVSAIHKKPTLLHLSSFLGIDTAAALDFFALMGILIAFSGFISQKFCVLPTFAALWSLYFSLIQIVQQFGNQADDLLLETGLICIILAPFTSPKTRSPVDSVGLLLLRWLTFRFMFTSGAVKLASGCATWWSLGGFLHHFETMPLPTPLSWYSHHLPESILKLTQVYVHVSELVIPWLFFVPNGSVRKFAFYWLIFLQLNIIPTGNYGLLNFLLITLLFSLLDDTHFYGKRQNPNQNMMGMVWTMAIIAGISFGTFKLFGLELKNGEILTKIAFTKAQYMDTLEKMVKISPLVALISILYGFLNTIITHDAIRKPTNLITKTLSVGKLLLFTIVALGLVGVSTVPHGKLHVNTNISMSSQIGQTYKQFHNYRMVNEYGLHLRKMRTERLEVVLEHAQNIEGPWSEIGFLYKPWNVNHSLPFAGPYLPRLDFQFYEAAPTSFNENLWITSLAYRILLNDAKVLHLFGVKAPLQPQPKFVRGVLYNFKYTGWSQREKTPYWTRMRLTDYIPALSASQDGPLHSYLKSLRIPLKYAAPKPQNEVLKMVLDTIREQVEKIEGSFFVLGVLAAGFAIIASQKRK